ncbi:MAG: polyprenyl synthetase family protein [Thermoplasmata archaeon]
MVDLISEMEKRKEKIDRNISDLFEESDHIIWDMMSWYPLAGGKKLRPFLTMVSAGALGGDEDRAMPVGVSLELIHNFTLVHDDIMDGDELRRGRKTLHRKENIPSAINAGDALFSLSFRELSGVDVDGETLRKIIYDISTSVVKIAEGQEEDMRFENTFDISEEAFISMIDKKTSWLFQACARCGAMVAGAEKEEIQKMGEYAKNMGIAFQIQDDYLDLIGNQDEIGKEVGSDIRCGKRTLVVIHTLSQLDGADAERLKELLDKEKNTDDEITEALDLMKKAGSLDYARSKAEMYGRKAKEDIAFLPDSIYKEILVELVDFMIKRET